MTAIKEECWCKLGLTPPSPFSNLILLIQVDYTLVLIIGICGVLDREQSEPVISVKHEWFLTT